MKNMYVCAKYSWLNFLARYFGGISRFTLPESNRTTMKKWISSKHLLVRFAGLYLMGLIIFTAAWFLSFYLFSEGVMRDTSLASKLAGSDISADAGREMIRIFVVNLLMGSFIIGFNYSFRINNLPLGYLIPPIWFLLYGLILGSNSFTFAMDERIGPSLAVLQRSGLYELAAYTLMAVSTYNISRFEIKALFKTNPEKIHNPVRFNTQQYLGLAVAVLILFASNFREALMLINQ